MIRFESYLNNENVRKSTRFTIKKIKILFFILSLFILFLGVMLVFDEEEGSFESGIFLVAFSILFYIFFNFILDRSMKKQSQFMPLISDNTKEEYRFFDDHYEITQINGNKYSSNLSSTYDFLFKVIENDEFILLYISQSQFHIVPKKNLVEGSLDDLKRILFNNLGKKYLRK